MADASFLQGGWEFTRQTVGGARSSDLDDVIDPASGTANIRETWRLGIQSTRRAY